MTNAPLGDDRATWVRQEVEELLERFDAEWQTGRLPALEEFLPADDGADPAFRAMLLAELIKVDLEYRWRQGKNAKGSTVRVDPPVPEPTAVDQHNESRSAIPDCPHLEDYLRHFPVLGPPENLPVELIAEEYRVRHRFGDRPPREIYTARFPQQAERLAALIDQIDDEMTRRPAEETTVSRGSRLSDVVLIEDSQQAEEPVVSPPRGRRGAGLKAAEPDLPERIGRYHIEGLLGRGAFGAVYLARDDDLNRRVAIKVPRAERFRTKQSVQLLFREARLAAQLRHPSLVEVYDVGREPPFRCYIVMEYIEGRPLNRILREETVSHAQAARWIFRVAEAVHCAHKVGLVHGDLKPGNILIDLEGRPHVADFGLAVSESEQRRMAGQVAGTPAFMSPEQVRGETHRLDGRTDLWSLGAVLYELLTGRMPFDGDDVDAIFDEVLHRDPRPPRQINDTISSELEWICLKCLSKPVTERYTTAMDLARDLRHAIDNMPPDSSFCGQAGGSDAIGDFGGGSLPWSVSTRATPGSRPGSMPLTNLSASPTSFIGRQNEVQEVARLLEDRAAWLITLTGAGGIGKTRLAQQVARHVLDTFAGGCWFADLIECRTSQAIAHAVADAFGVPLTGSEQPELVVAHVLEYRKPLVLVLDNFEQAVHHAQATVGLWRTHAPHVKFLVTSRSPLALSGEREYELSPLPAPQRDGDESAPATPEELLRFDSVQLFCERAREVAPHFTLDRHSAPAVARICAELQGLPLAVELAAARVKVLKPEQMAAKLGQKFQLLQSSRQDLAPRQQTLLGAIDWSFDLLGPWEKQAFLQCAIFRGGFSLEGAEAVVDLSEFPAAPLSLDVVQSLREKSLLTSWDAGYDTRFDMYLSIRDYAEQKWRATADAAAQQRLAERFAAYVIDAAQAASEKVYTADAVSALDRLGLERLNVFAVQDWALSRGQPEMAARAILAVDPLLAVRGPADRRVARLERSLSEIAAEAIEPRVALLTALSEACQAVGSWDRAVSLADAAVATAGPLGRDRLLARALFQQGEMRRNRGDLEGANTCYVQSESIFRQLDDRHGLSRAMVGRGIVAWQRADSSLALQCYAEAETIAQARGDSINLATISRNRGHVLWRQGDFTGALRCYAEAEALARQLGDERTICQAIGNRGIVLAEQGNYDGALECYAEAESLARRLGDKRGIAINVGNRGIALYDRGEVRQALVCYTEAEAINRQMQTKFGIAVNVGNRANALCDLGQLDAAMEALAEAEATNRELGDKFQYALNIGDRGNVLLKLDRPAESREALREALFILDEIGCRTVPEFFAYQALLAQVEQQLGNRLDAAMLARDALSLAEALGLTEHHPKLKTREQLTALRAIVPEKP